MNFELFCCSQFTLSFMFMAFFYDQIFSNLSIICLSSTLFALDFHCSSILSLYALDYEMGSGFLMKTFCFFLKYCSSRLKFHTAAVAIKC